MTFFHEVFLDIRTKGIFLKGFPYDDHTYLITLFTDSSGLIPALSKKKNSLAPFLEAEWTLYKGKSSFFRLIEYQQTYNHALLRSSLELIEFASLITRSILKSQLQEKSNPGLYELFALYLKKLPLLKNRRAAVASFLAKLLKHEGLLYKGTGLEKLAAMRSFGEIEDVEKSEELYEEAVALFTYHFDSL